MKIAIWNTAPYGYHGGINYYWNLFFAINAAQTSLGERVECLIFFGEDVPLSTEIRLQKVAKVVKTDLLTRWHPFWYFEKVLERFFGIYYFQNRMLKAHGVDVLTHAYSARPKTMFYQTVYWVPDFQFAYYETLFSPGYKKHRLREIADIAAAGNKIVVSSNAAKNDFEKFIGSEHLCNVHVLSFVSQPGTSIEQINSMSSGILEKYGLNGSYLIVANQFWAHKDHLCVLEAMKILAADGRCPQVVFTGGSVDYRDGGSESFQECYSFFIENGLADACFFLGDIPYEELLCLIFNAAALVNPSWFEGWNSAIEEAKTLGVTVIASDIPVHREQLKSAGAFFQTRDSKQLSKLMLDASRRSVKKTNTSRLDNELVLKTTTFGNALLRVLG